MTLKKNPFAASHPNKPDLDLKYMQLALGQAQKAQLHGDVPVGAVLVGPDGQVLAKSGNIREKEQTCLGHAEMATLHRACKKLNSWRLTGCTLYVTLEPCFMCAGALIQARIERVVFAARDPKGGALVSLAQLGQDPRLNHQLSVTEGVLAEQSSLLLKNFFKKRRENKKGSR